MRNESIFVHSTLGTTTLGTIFQDGAKPPLNQLGMILKEMLDVCLQFQHLPEDEPAATQLHYVKT